MNLSWSRGLRSKPFACLLAAVGLLAWMSATADGAVVEHQQVVAGLHDATLEARINPEGVVSKCRAELVTTAAFEATAWATAQEVPCSPEGLGSGSEGVAASASFTGLGFSTAYRYRFLLNVSDELTPGPEGEFSTFGLKTVSFRTLNGAGEPETQAGSHPYELVAEMTTPTTTVEGTEGTINPAGTIKELLDELPPGLIGNPTAVPRCSRRTVEEKRCSDNAQVGIISTLHGNGKLELTPLYNTIPPRGVAARFAGAINGGTDGFIDSSIRTGQGYGITSGGYNISPLSNTYGVTIRLWGIPADPGHDSERYCQSPGGGAYFPGCAASGPVRPFLSMPTSCAGALNVVTQVNAYQSPNEWDSKSATIPAITGCDRVGFEPSIEVKPTNEVTDSPTGLEVDLHIPQNEDPEGLRTADLRDAVVKLPPGLTLNPSSANGLVGCPQLTGDKAHTGEVGIDLEDSEAADCPEAAKIGTVEVDTPLLDHPLPGAIYVAEPYENPFDSLLAIYIAVNDPESGVVIKLAGDIEIGPEGQLTTSFDENPQLPFEDFKLDFFGGDLSALKTPATCGNYATESTLTPWSAPASGPPASLSNTSAVTQAAGGGSCPTSAGAEPTGASFEAGSESPLAGAYTPFVLHLARVDGSQQISSLSVNLPPGLLGKLAGIPYCSEANLAEAAAKSGKEEQASPSCPSASQVGTVTVGAGAGSKPYYAAGKAYLAGPYKGAPLSLAIVTPAVAGPYDLGDVVVRSALEVNTATTQITVVSDPIPTELKGIPLDIRSIAVKIDHSSFTRNPTSCESMALGGTMTTVTGVAVPLSNRFQAGNCSSLAFKPKLALRVYGKTNRNSKPRLRAVLQMKSGEADIRRAQVNLPHSLFLEQNHIKTVCTRIQWAEGNGNGSACPKGSIYGQARAFSPLLAAPLEGPVYLRSSSNKLPDLVAALDGQINVELDGKVDSGPNHGLRNTFELVPDAPVSKFILELKGGGKGLLVNSEPLCAKHAKRNAIVRFVGQNGKVETFKPKVAASCKPAPKKSR